MTTEWLSRMEIQARVGTPPPIRLTRAFGLRQLLLGGLMAPDFSVDPRWASSVTLSPAGEEVAKLLSDEPRLSTEEERKYVLFRLFYYLDVLIDCERTDLQTIQTLIHEAVLQRTLVIPHRFGRELYDRFNDNFHTSRTDHLLYTTAYDLVRDEPQGIYQMGKLVTGPLGVLEAAEGRLSPPSLKVPLWHCSDTGCQALHSVQLLEDEQGYAATTSRIRRVLKEQHGPPSEWVSALSRYLREDDEPRPFYDLPSFLADGLAPNERDLVFRKALSERTGATIRQVLAHLDNPEITDRGAPDRISDSLPERADLQLLLLPPDSDLVSLLDQAVEEKLIRPAKTGVRVARQRPGRVSNGDTRTELGRLGARSYRGNPLANLWQLVWRAYEEGGLMDELEWRLRSRRGESPKIALMNYLQEEPLESVLQQLVLSSPRVTQYFKTNVPGLQFDGINGRDVEKMLWKLGFDIPVFDDTYLRLRDRLTAFEEVVLSATTPWDEDVMEAIRGVGVNLFVSVEQFFEELVSYNVWLLSSDHFFVTNFEYSESEALAAVGRELGDLVTSGTEEVRWSSQGKNTLGTLLVYLFEALEWMKRVSTLDTKPYERPQSDLPHFAADLYREFPFRHTALWADGDADELRAYIGSFSEVAQRVAKSRAAEVRNGLDHKRSPSDYPTPDTMMLCVREIRSALDIADGNRLIPKPYWLRRTTTDMAGRVRSVLFDYRERELDIEGPQVSWLAPDLRFGSPAVIAPGNIFGLPNGEITFQIDEETSFDRYWEGYPRRRRIPPQRHESDQGTVEVDHSVPKDEPIVSDDN